MNLIERSKSYIHGVETIYQWLGAGGWVVSQETAQQRASICLTCPLNKQGLQIAESIAIAIRKQIELKNNLSLRTKGEKKLHTCSACLCPIRLKIWLPLEKILPEPDERAKFDERCWLLTETKP